MTRKERNQRVLFTISLLIVHFMVTYLRGVAYEEHWNGVVKIVLGSAPSFYAVIGLTVLFNIFERNKRATMPLLAGIGSLLYEITGDFGRKSGRGATIDTLDVIAIFAGILVAYLIEKYFFSPKYKHQD